MRAARRNELDVEEWLEHWTTHKAVVNRGLYARDLKDGSKRNFVRHANTGHDTGQCGFGPEWSSLFGQEATARARPCVQHCR